MQTQAAYLIERFGGINAMARALGHQFASTVQGWKERGVVPARRHPEVLAAGADLMPPLEMREFFESLGGEPHAPASDPASPDPSPREAAA